ncbi:hypothetical protein CLOM_g9207 [Closterium sp. NIES-68]|nr:hypothetical protein CLOM_g9207 [Closterium sp. NIES-68]GJP61429.1 hypothetical protein CLOP_g18595 [Closterium sp. NIES-67]
MDSQFGFQWGYSRGRGMDSGGHGGRAGRSGSSQAGDYAQSYGGGRGHGGYSRGGWGGRGGGRGGGGGRPGTGSSDGHERRGPSLWTFLPNDRDFTNQFQMRMFVQAMEAHDASDLVMVLADDKLYGRKKLLSICKEAVSCGPSKSLSAGSHPRTVSFQSVILPMLQVICQPAFFNNPASSKVNTTLAAIAEVEGFQEYLVTCMRLLTQRGMIRDLGRGEDDGIKDWDVAFGIVFSFFHETMLRFYSLFDAAQASKDLQELESMLAKWQGEKPVFDGKYHHLWSVIYRLRRALDVRSHSERQKQRMEEGQLLHEDFFPSGQRLSSMQAVDGPGELSLAGRPRHDNDHAEISAISVAPTMEEVLCKVAPYLPHNHANEPHHLPAGSVGRHVDIQFRLLRHDLVAPLWSKALFLFQRLNYESSRAARGGSSSTGSASCSSGSGGREEAMGLVRADRDLVRGLTDNMKGVVGFSSEDMDVYLLRDVKVLSINTDKRSGVFFLIDFMEPPMPRGRRAHNRVEFWENTRRLQNGSLVCLWIRDMQPTGGHRGQDNTDSGSHRLVFATITARDTQRLAFPRPQIGVQPCQGNGFSADLLGLIAQGGGAAGAEQRTQVVMLEAHGSFFAYEPILKALQTITEASLPFSEYICAAPGGAPGRAAVNLGYRLPAYIKGGMMYDLGLLLQTKPSSSHAQNTAQNGAQNAAECAAGSAAESAAEDSFAIRNVIVSNPTAFPIDALLRCTSLDRPQAVGLQAALTQEFALLQGPPGTGKTFVGIKLVEILLSNALKGPGTSAGGSSSRGTDEASPLGPILCVCFTNHALDQFLEGLIASGIKRVVRVGGRSRSESLQEYNLSNIIRGANPYHSRTYRDSSYEVRSRLREVEAVIATYSDALQQRTDNALAVPWRAISSHLMANHPTFFQALRTSKEADDDGFEQVGLDNWSRWKRGLAKEIPRRKKKGSNLGREGREAAAGLGIFPQTLEPGTGDWGAVGTAAPSEEAPTQNPYEALSMLGGVEVGEGWHLSSGSDSGVGDELRGLVELMSSIYVDDEGDDGGDGDDDGEAVDLGSRAAGGHGSSGTGHATGSRAAGLLSCLGLGALRVMGVETAAMGARMLEQSGKGSQRGGVTVEDLFQAFGDLGNERGRGNGEELIDKPQMEQQQETEEQQIGPVAVDEASDREVDELLYVEDPWATSAQERRKLVEFWVGEVRATANAAIEAEVENFARKVQERSELQQVEDLQVLQRAQVVGMTTSGVAKMQRLITALGPRVVIVEEAAEVLEAHILTSLTPQTQHVILIGDHLQLRPKVELYELSKDSYKGFDLDVSLFERLALSKQIPVFTLATQRRMRPEIADLIRSTIYPDLRDHPFVEGYPDVRGMASNLHFWDHESPESGGDDLSEGKSKSNAGEAAMVVGLATYLLQQGYAGGEITILTPYVGQLLKLRQALSQVVNVRLGEGDAEVVEEAEEKAATRGGGPGAEDSGSGEAAGSAAGQGKGLGLGFTAPKATTANLRDAVRLATIDNFQGEESTVVIVSLVRNNLDGKIGFLKSPNRTNVLLSRAKHGMYLIGNANTMRACSTRAGSKSVLWPRILDILQGRGGIQRFIPLRCVNHPATVTRIHGAREFREKASEGGCSEMCGFRLTPCGHTCPRRCHGDDRAHANAFCPKECSRIRPLEECPYQHTCAKQCGEVCGPCSVKISSLTLPCGHQAFNIPCFQAHKPTSIFCSVIVEVTMPLCGHKQTVQCSEAANRLSNPKLCTARCGVVLSDSCGHTCISPCGQCIAAPAANSEEQNAEEEEQEQARQQQQPAKKHKKCTQPCKRPLPCGHLCPDTCHDGRPCNLCFKKCLVACQHSSCPQPCHRTCAPCAEPCGWNCKHQGACSLPCGAPCDRLPCERRCEKALQCGHQCPSLCGEKCPPKAFCTAAGCGAQEKREMTVDLVTLETLGEIDPDESPVLVLPCGHAYTMDTLDGHLGLNQVYLESEASYGSSSGVGADGPGAGSGLPAGDLGGGSSCAGGGAGAKWVAVLPFEDGNLSALKGCPECRQPITGFRRYGRMVNKALLDQSERKFALSCSADQEGVQRKLSRLSQVISSLPETAQPRQLQELAQAATRLIHETGRLRTTAVNPPTQQTYQASVAALQRRHYLLGDQSRVRDSTASSGSGSRKGKQVLSGTSAGPTASTWEEECQLLYVPQPDPRPLCEALMMLGKAFQLLMAANFLQLRCLLKNVWRASGPSRLSSGGSSSRKAAYLSRRVEDCRAVVRVSLRIAEKYVGQAIKWAVKRKAHRLEARARLELVDVYRAFVEGMMAERLLSNSPAGLGGPKKQQLEYLEKAKIQCRMVAYHHLASVRENDTLGESARRLLDEDLPTLEASVRDEPRYFALSEHEKGDVYRAIGLGGGHWYRCPNGHLYVIGECGRAWVESRCPECNEVVGGSGHVLREGNVSASDFFRGA